MNKITKECLIELDILRVRKSGHLYIRKENIPEELLTLILSKTNKCRDKISEKIYWVLNGIEDYPYCLCCDKQFIPKFHGLMWGYRNATYCSVQCVNNSTLVHETRKKATFEKYGDPNYRNVPKAIQTSLNKYGEVHPTKSQVIKDKNKKECLLKWHVENVYQHEYIKELIRRTNLVRRNVEYAAQCPIVIAKQKNTFLKNYGPDNIDACVELKNKQLRNSYKYKKLILPSGKIHIYQGYENVAILELLKTYNEQDLNLNASEIPIFFYNDNKKKYFPDIYVPKDNLIIEVKSTYTYRITYDANYLKATAAKNEGYRFEFWICDKNFLIEKVII